MPPSLVAPRRSKKSWQTSRLWKRIVLWAVLTLTITVVILFALQEGIALKVR
jgi:ACR3 family arsenite efflux pump ArsB